MKKQTTISLAILIILGITAFSFINWKNTVTEKHIKDVAEVIELSETTTKKFKPKVYSEFIYGVGPRFQGIKKRDFDKATSLADFLDDDVVASIVSLESVDIKLFKDNEVVETKATGTSLLFNETQLQLLKSFDYSTNFVVSTYFKQRNATSGNIETTHYTPHLTIIPETQATYAHGESALIEFLQDGSLEARAHVNPDKLQPAKLFFTVTKKGTIEHIHLDQSSNYPEVDKKMIELLQHVPASWIPAKDDEGNLVDQELVVSFGLMGC